MHSIFGLRFESLVESLDGVESELTDVESGETHFVRSKYAVGANPALAL